MAQVYGKTPGAYTSYPGLVTQSVVHVAMLSLCSCMFLCVALPPPLPHLVPSAPLNLTVSATGRRSINVTWSPPANPNGILLFYQLEYSIVGQSSMTLDVPAESLAASLVELTPAQVYQVTVRANTSVGFGSRSEPVRATTGLDSECDHTHNTQHYTPHPQHTTLHTTTTAHNTTHHNHNTTLHISALIY